MKKLIGILLCGLFILSACSTSVNKTSNSASIKDYKLENGKTVKVPEKPKRVVVLTGFYVGDFIKLGITPIAVSDITKDSSILKPYLKGVDFIGENAVEKVAKAKPDLIVVDAMDKNINKYQKIAPTVPYTYNKYNHKEILREIGKLTNNEEKALKWIKEWDDKTQKDKEEIQSKIGQVTASVFETDEKQIYIYNSTWGRGLDIVHDAFGMRMTKQYKNKLQEDKKGYASISKENISEYAGDYIFLSKPSYSTFDFEKSNTWRNIDAVKKGHVISYKAEDYWFTDPITLESLRSKLKEQILNKSH
ncbi:ferrichrome ABC transporter substrate-binding protein [Staphylococcus schleiferi]|uniref:iron-hydroxamate ABC transporter substrate-binding protein n=1 Tax=Staphylococcus sp. 191 TaxID=2070016 RepID=UPI0013F3E211|nr:iron-hydroxamate ABC transporter substrate-binding protein [Staphylococcus sp. 191]NHA36806.1 ferrichrome ABC transporter substrate-binding protein [Staphylococcus schleiferi]NHB72118.1 ferrichrome ABC transporter substrate-binding protein [Staphylococcus sp. 191]